MKTPELVEWRKKAECADVVELRGVPQGSSRERMIDWFPSTTLVALIDEVIALREVEDAARRLLVTGFEYKEFHGYDGDTPKIKTVRIWTPEMATLQDALARLRGGGK